MASELDASSLLRPWRWASRQFLASSATAGRLHFSSSSSAHCFRSDAGHTTSSCRLGTAQARCIWLAFVSLGGLLGCGLSRSGALPNEALHPVAVFVRCALQQGACGLAQRVDHGVVVVHL